MMLSSRIAFATPAAFAPHKRIAARPQAVRTVAALPERQQCVFQAAGSSMLAAAVAAGMLLAPMPASADMTFGRKALVAERQAEFDAVLARMNDALAQVKKSSAGAAGAVQSAASDATSQVASVADKVKGASQAAPSIKSVKQAAKDAAPKPPPSVSAAVTAVVDKVKEAAPAAPESFSDATDKVKGAASAAKSVSDAGDKVKGAASAVRSGSDVSDKVKEAAPAAKAVADASSKLKEAAPSSVPGDSDVKGAAAGATQEAKSNIDSAVSDFIGKF